VRGDEALAFTSGNLHSAHADALLAWRGARQGQLLTRCVNGRRKCERADDGVPECPVTLDEALTDETGPDSVCSNVVSFGDLVCRLGEVAARTDVATELGGRRRGFVRRVERAQARVADGAKRCAARFPGPARRRLRSASRALRGFATYLRADPRRCRLPPRVRSDLEVGVQQVILDLSALRDGTACR
jgi:hypothetical protein